MFEVYLAIVVGHSQFICHTLLVQSIECLLQYLIVSVTVETYLR